LRKLSLSFSGFEYDPIRTFMHPVRVQQIKISQTARIGASTFGRTGNLRQSVIENEQESFAGVSLSELRIDDGIENSSNVVASILDPHQELSIDPCLTVRSC
jgi:hypothetical protein